jgi:hypothetical protein
MPARKTPMPNAAEIFQNQEVIKILVSLSKITGRRFSLEIMIQLKSLCREIRSAGQNFPLTAALSSLMVSGL